MNGPWQITSTDDNEDGQDYSKTVISDNEDDVLDYSLGTLDAEDDSGRTVTVTEADDE